MSEPLPSTSGTEPDLLRPDQIGDEPPTLFSLGNVVATPPALRLIEQHGSSIPQLLNRHQTGDWQELCAEDRNANLQAVVNGDRILSVFNIASSSQTDKPVKIWIITEWDRSVTTILRPQDY